MLRLVHLLRLLHSHTRWLRLALACLLLVTSANAARAAVAVSPVTVVEGGPGKKPLVAPPRAELVQRLRPRSAPPKLDARLEWPPTEAPRPSKARLFLLHRALLC